MSAPAQEAKAGGRGWRSEAEHRQRLQGEGPPPPAPSRSQPHALPRVWNQVLSQQASPGPASRPVSGWRPLPGPGATCSVLRRAWPDAPGGRLAFVTAIQEDKSLIRAKPAAGGEQGLLGPTGRHGGSAAPAPGGRGGKRPRREPRGALSRVLKPVATGSRFLRPFCPAAAETRSH